MNRVTHLDKVTGATVRDGDVVRKGLRWLVERQAVSGEIPASSDASVLENALAALALGEAYGLTDAVYYRAPVSRAAHFLASRREKDGGWGSAPGEPSATVPTLFSVLALESARAAGTEIDEGAFLCASRFLQRQELDRAAGAGPIQAAAILLTRKAGVDCSTAACSALLAEAPSWNPEPSSSRNDPESWFLGTIALYRDAGPKSAEWKSWSRALSQTLLMNVHPGGAHETDCVSGSWDVLGEQQREGGRVCVTALDVLSLEVYYRYATALGETRRAK